MIEYTIITLNTFCSITYFGLDRETSVVHHHVIDISATRGKKLLYFSNYFTLVCHLFSLTYFHYQMDYTIFTLNIFCYITYFGFRSRNICSTPSSYRYQRNTSKKRLYFCNYFNLVSHLLMKMVINLLSLIEGSLIDEIHHFHIKYFLLHYKYLS